jgi:hypothetical protein
MQSAIAIERSDGIPACTGFNRESSETNKRTAAQKEPMRLRSA